MLPTNEISGKTFAHFFLSFLFSECSCVVGFKSKCVGWMGLAEKGDALISMASSENNM